MADTLEAQVAAIRATMEAQHTHNREAFSRIETKLDTYVLAASDRSQDHGERLLKLETDAKWHRIIAGPLVAVAVTTVAAWFKGWVGLN